MEILYVAIFIQYAAVAKATVQEEQGDNNHDSHCGGVDHSHCRHSSSL